MSFNLRKKPRVSYYEPEEPSFDEYVYCEKCLDFVYDYCAIHGPLLVIPDDKVPAETNLPSYVPRAALTIPHIFLHLAPSIIPGAGLGVFSTLTLPRGVRFGPYRGQRTNVVDSMYCWQIHNRNNKRVHVIDAVNSDRSNWMRYVNCARHWKEQNLLAYQFKGQLYYRTIKIIPRFTELLVFYGSEYANALQINLAKYNSVEYYRQIISTQLAPVEAKKQITEQDYLTEEQFHFIDEETQEKMPYDVTKQPIAAPSDINENTKEIGNGHNSKFECETCNKTFLKQKYLKRHKLIHSRITKQPMAAPTDINENTKEMGNGQNSKFECETCKKIFLKQKYLKRHKLIHSRITKQPMAAPSSINENTKEIGNGQNSKFECETCKKLFLKQKYLKRHKLIHSRITNRTIPPSSDSKENIKEIGNGQNSKFECEICKKIFLKQEYLKRHTLLHSETWRFACDKCDYKTNYPYRFTRHLALPQHVNKTEMYKGNFKCNNCCYSSNAKRNLAQHIKRIHK